jgi:hypothetical protein
VSDYRQCASQPCRQAGLKSLCGGATLSQSLGARQNHVWSWVALTLTLTLALEPQLQLFDAHVWFCFSLTMTLQPLPAFYLARPTGGRGGAVRDPHGRRAAPVRPARGGVRRRQRARARRHRLHDRESYMCSWTKVCHVEYLSGLTGAWYGGASGLVRATSGRS